MDNTIILILFTKLIFWTQIDATHRWSRQISNSDWVPLINHKPSQRSQSDSQENVFLSTLQINGDSTVSLSPLLQTQYQDQLIQLLKTQESIQKLLDLQKQLRVQQQLLQVKGDFNNQEPERGHHHSTMTISQKIPQLAPEVSMDPNMGSRSFSTKFTESNFYSGDDKGSGPFNPHRNSESQHKENTEQYSDAEKQYINTEKNFESYKRYKSDNKINFLAQPSSKQNESDDTEIQLLYVPAETLIQKSQGNNQNGRTRIKQTSYDYENSQEIQYSPVLSQKSFPTEHLDQSQYIAKLADQFLQEERLKDRNKQSGLQRVVDVNGNPGSERRKLFELRSEEKIIRQDQNKHEQLDKPLGRTRNFENEKNVNYKGQIDYTKEFHKLKDTVNQRYLPGEKEVEKQRFQEIFYHSDPSEHPAFRNRPYINQNLHLNEYEIADSQSLIRNEQRDQFLKEDANGVTIKRKSKLQSQMRQRNDINNEEDGGGIPPTPNQPPLSIYMCSKEESQRIEIHDLLELLQNTKSIAVIDNIDPNMPNVFIGPAYMDTPTGYKKFNLPYLSAIENYFDEEDVVKFPFFVAPLSFIPPRGYFKIPFPHPHIGSIIVSIINHKNDSPSTESTSSTIRPFYAPYDKFATAVFSTEVVASMQYKEPQFYQESKTLVDATASVMEGDEFIKNKSHLNTFPTYSGNHDTTYVTPYQKNYSHSTFLHQKNLHPGTNLDMNQKKSDQYIQYNIKQTDPSVINSHLNYNPENKEVIKSNHYNLPAKLPAISSQLPGLVNSLMERNEGIIFTTPLTETSTFTTTEAPSTTARIRGRQRGKMISTKSTTMHPPLRPLTNKSLRQLTRSSSRLNTTTQKAQESSYEPKNNNPGTTDLHYVENESRSSLSGRNQKLRGRNDKANQSKILDRLQHQNGKKDYLHLNSAFHPKNDNFSLQAQNRTYVYNSINQDQLFNNTDSMSQPIYQQFHQFTNKRNLSSSKNEGFKKQLEIGFKYGTPATQSPLKDYFNYQSEKIVNIGNVNADNLKLPAADESEHKKYLQFNIASQSRVNLNSPNQNFESTEGIDYETYQIGNTTRFPNSQFESFKQNEKQFDDEMQDHNTEPSTELLTEYPVIPALKVSDVIREGVREDLNDRVQQKDQIRPQEMQTDLVRISTVHQASKKLSQNSRNRSRENTSGRLKTRTRPIFKDSQIQVDSQDYVRIQSATKDRKSFVSSATPESVTVLNTSDSIEQYGFVRPPKFSLTKNKENFQNVYNKTKQNQEGIKTGSNGATVLPETFINQKRNSKLRPIYLKSSDRNVDIKTTTFRTILAPLEQLRNTSSSKSAADDIMLTKIRGRARRPSKRKTTTTSTEASLEDHYELQFNEENSNMAEVTSQTFTTSNNMQYYSNVESIPNYD